MSDEDGEWLAEDICNALQEIRADVAARCAALDDALDMAAMQGPPAIHRHVAARFDSMCHLTEISISPVAVAGYTHTELTEIVTEVLRGSRQHLLDTVAAVTSRLWGPLMLGECERAPVAAPERIFMETSGDGDLSLALDAAGRLLWCDIGPHAIASGAALLGEHIVHLHTLARMRLLLDLSSRAGTQYGPTAAEIDAYRRRYLTF